jgi:hypothetical protein
MEPKNQEKPKNPKNKQEIDPFFWFEKPKQNNRCVTRAIQIAIYDDTQCVQVRRQRSAIEWPHESQTAAKQRERKAADIIFSTSICERLFRLCG